MHELAHLLLGHDPTTVYIIGEEGLALREFDQPKEQEADWLAGALLLPRGVLLAVVNGGADDSDVCHTYGVSQQMLEFRIRMTGVKRQIERRRKRG